jgi:hypothetical protein
MDNKMDPKAEGIASQGISSPEGQLLSMQLAYLRSDVSEVKSSVSNMASTLAGLVRIEEQQSSFREGLSRAFTENAKTNKHAEELDKRIDKIEGELPSYRGLRRWVIGGILTGIAMLSIALFNQLVIDPMRRGWSIPTPQKSAFVHVDLKCEP